MLIVQNYANPSRIRNAIVDLVSKDLIGFDIAAAYTTMSGTEMLIESIIQAVGNDIFASMPKTLITSFDYGITETQALNYWSDINNVDIRITGADIVRNGTTQPRSAFHPKLYIFHIDGGFSNILVSSANLTSRGFTSNTEAGWSQRNVATNQINQSFHHLYSRSEPLTAELITLYSQVLSRQEGSPDEIIEAKTVPDFNRNNVLHQLKDEVERGLELSEFEIMWLQVGSLQGGSENQLELPRTGNQFFGFSFDSYEEQQIIIGTLELRMSPKTWLDRPLTWHGNNKMERLNLPTQMQGGPEYSNSAIMFKRLTIDTYELIVTPVHSDLAKLWGQASAQSGHLYKLGSSADGRLVGLI